MLLIAYVDEYTIQADGRRAEPNVVCLAVFDSFVWYLLSPQCASGVCMLYYVPHIPTCAELVLTAVTLIGVSYFPATEGKPYLLRYGLSSFSPATECSS